MWSVRGNSDGKNVRIRKPPPPFPRAHAFGFAGTTKVVSGDAFGNVHVWLVETGLLAFRYVRVVSWVRVRIASLRYMSRSKRDVYLTPEGSRPLPSVSHLSSTLAFGEYLISLPCRTHRRGGGTCMTALSYRRGRSMSGFRYVRVHTLRNWVLSFRLLGCTSYVICPLTPKARFTWYVCVGFVSIFLGWTDDGS